MDNTATMVTIRYLSNIKKKVGLSKEEFSKTLDLAWEPSKWFVGDATSYNPGLSVASMALCQASYGNTASNGCVYLRDSLDEMGFEALELSSYEHRTEEDPSDYTTIGIDISAYGFGHQSLRLVSGELVDLFVVVVRGTTPTVEWNSNGNIADSVSDGRYEGVLYHEGFKLAEEELAQRLGGYLAQFGDGLGKARIWITGHSRGAAVANLLAADIDEGRFGFEPQNVYAYTFAAPLCTRRTDARDCLFQNVLNVINPEDFVPRLPLGAWGFRRFGHNLYLPSKTTGYGVTKLARSAIGERFRGLSETEYESFGGSAATDRFVRNATNLCPTITDLYATPHYSEFGGLTFREYFFLFTNGCAVHGLAKKRAALELVGHSQGAYAPLFAYLFDNQELNKYIPFGHASEGYLAKVMALGQLGVKPYEVCDTRRLTIYGPVDILIADGRGERVASVQRGRVDRTMASYGDALAVYEEEPGEAVSVWIPKGQECDVRLGAAASGASLECVWADFDPEGAVSWQECYGQLQVPFGELVSWERLVEQGAAASVYRGGQRCLRTTVVGDGDAVGVYGATAGDHVAVSAYHSPGVRFIGWFEGGQRICAHRTYSTALWNDRSLEARFERL